MNTDFNKKRVVEYNRYLLTVKRYSENTVNSYIGSIIKFFNYCEKDSGRIYMSDVDDYIEYLVIQNLSFSTQNIFISSLILYFKKFHPERRFANKLERPVSEDAIPNTLSKDEVNMLINSYRNVKHKAIIAFIYYHGLRRSEAINFKLSDFDKGNGMIKINKSKRNKDRQVGLNLKCRQILIEYFQKYTPEWYLFNGQNSPKYSASSMANILKQGLESIGISKHITLHSLRHSYACHLYEQGIQLSHIQTLLGHKSEKTVKIYARVAPDYLRKIQIAS